MANGCKRRCHGAAGQVVVNQLNEITALKPAYQIVFKNTKLTTSNHNCNILCQHSQLIGWLTWMKWNKTRIQSNRLRYWLLKTKFAVFSQNGIKLCRLDYLLFPQPTELVDDILVGDRQDKQNILLQFNWNWIVFNIEGINNVVFKIWLIISYVCMNIHEGYNVIFWREFGLLHVFI